MKRVMWKIEDFIDAILYRLSGDLRWALIDLLMRHGISKACRVSGYMWAMYPTEGAEGSIFEISDCTRCEGDPYTFCGKPMPEAKR